MIVFMHKMDNNSFSPPKYSLFKYILYP